MGWIARELALGQLRIEARVLCDPRRRQVVRMHVFRVRRKEDLATLAPKYGGKRMARLDGVLERSIREPQVDASGSKQPIRLSRLRTPPFGRPGGSGLSAREIDDQNGVPFGDEASDRAAHAEFGIIRMRCDDDDLHSAAW
jgi:hypothetical protein